MLLKIDVQGARQVSQQAAPAVLVFLAPSSLHDLIDRLHERNTETGIDLDRRLRDAENEMAGQTMYDYVVVNGPGGVVQAAGDVGCIVRAERLRVLRRSLPL